MLNEIEKAKLELQLMKIQSGKREKEIQIMERMQDVNRIKNAIAEFENDIERINIILKEKE